MVQDRCRVGVMIGVKQRLGVTVSIDVHDAQQPQP
jgi:hypothetical protein